MADGNPPWNSLLFGVIELQYSNHISFQRAFGETPHCCAWAISEVRDWGWGLVFQQIGSHSLLYQPLTPNPQPSALFLCPQIRISFNLDLLYLGSHKQRFFGIEVNGNELQTRVFLPILDAIFPDPRLRTMM
jgi:hypothetical protein